MLFLGPNTFVDGQHIPNAIARNRYELSVMQVRDRIKTSAFGAAFLDLVTNNPQPIVIAPAPNRNQVDSHALKAKDAFASGQSIPNNAGLTAFGTGKGSMTVIDYNPAGDFRDVGPDGTLVHELTHAYRQTRGRWRAQPMADLISKEATEKSTFNARIEQVRFSNWEEFLAVVVEGTYRATQGATTVRTAHGQTFFDFAIKTEPQAPNIFNPLPMTDSQLFAERYRPALKRILVEERDLYKLLLHADAWFNPVRDMAKMHAYKNQPPPKDPASSTIFDNPIGG